MPKPTAGKWRALRVTLPKHSTMDARERLRVGLTIAAILILAGWFFVGFLLSDGGASRYSPGPLSSNHEQFSCQACHDDFSPMRDDVMGAAWGHWHGTAGARWDRGSDRKCMVCHPLLPLPVGHLSADPANQLITGFQHDVLERPLPIFAHSDNELTNQVESCASCHVEHLGADTRLTNVKDEACVRCHENLNSCARQTPVFATKITDFPTDHPAFRSFASDPGTMQDFKHRLHMWPGLNPPSVSGETRLKPKRLSDFEDSSGSLSTYENQENLVQLRCEFCHRQAGDSSGANTTAVEFSQFGGKSAFMTMPTYAENCQVCHPLTVQFDQASESESEAGWPRQTIEHGLSPDATRQRLIELLTVMSVEALKTADPSIHLNQEQELLARKIWEAIKNRDDSSPVSQLRDKLLKEESKVRLQCGKCHSWSETSEGQSMEDKVGPVQTIGTSNDVYLRSWLKHGRFDHYEHRDMDCKRCHAAAYAERDEAGQRASEKNSDVLIANYDTCVQCHQPAKQVRGGNRAAAYNCTFCHSYHGGGNREHQIHSLTSE